MLRPNTHGRELQQPVPGGRRVGEFRHDRGEAFRDQQVVPKRPHDHRGRGRRGLPSHPAFPYGPRPKLPPGPLRPFPALSGAPRREHAVEQGARDDVARGTTVRHPLGEEAQLGRPRLTDQEQALRQSFHPPRGQRKRKAAQQASPAVAGRASRARDGGVHRRRSRCGRHRPLPDRRQPVARSMGAGRVVRQDRRRQGRQRSPQLLRRNLPRLQPRLEGERRDEAASQRRVLE